MTVEIGELRDEVSARNGLLALNNSNAQETSLLTRAGFDRMISSASVATFIAPSAAFLLAFEESDAYEGGHFLWFRSRFDRFLYVDRVVVAAAYRRRGFGRLLYCDLIKRAEQRGHTRVVCEVNLVPPNPTSDKFHAAHGFEEVGRAALDGGAKTVRYLLRRCR
jgi:predicted GNAT superfamily acetyltransferase